MKPYYAYAEKVLSGEITVGRLVYLAVQRFESWLLRDDIEFRESEADAVIDFFALLKHFKGKHAGKSFALEPWQQFAVACIYGFFWRSSGLRVVTSVYIEIARKNGKTALAAGLGLYHLIGDGERGAEVDFAANSKDQAKIAFDFASKFARGLNTKRKTYLEAYRDKILLDLTDSKMQVFAADASNLDGFDASMYLLDEYHAAKDGKLKDVLQSSQASREQPMAMIITTAGFDKMGPCYEYRTMCTEMLNGLVEDDSLFALIFSLDDEDIEGDGWQDPANWPKCNPNLGVIVKDKFLADQVTKAKNKPSEEVGIKTKSFNIWCDTAETWIPERYILASASKHNIVDFYKPDDEVYAGIDLSSTSDLAAVSYMIPREDGIYFWVDYYLPEDTINDSPLKERYKEWRRLGHLKVTPGNVIDYDYILHDLMTIDKVCQFRAIGYDPWNATQFVVNAETAGLPMRSYGQNIGNFNKPTKELERMIKSGRAHIGNNPITRFCFRNVQIKMDYNGNTKPDKAKSNNKIDGVIAMIEALGIYLQNPRYNYKI